MGCEENFIIMKLHWHSYLVFTLDNCAYETYIVSIEEVITELAEGPIRRTREGGVNGSR
jgi:hypothetical protein